MNIDFCEQLAKIIKEERKHMKNKVNPIIVIFVVFIIWGLYYAFTHFEQNNENNSVTEEVINTSYSQSYNVQYEEFLSHERSGINLDYQYNPKDDSFTGGYYQLQALGDKCQFIYRHDEEEIYCDFTIEKFEELKSLLLSVELKPYETPSDENGKLIYEIVPRMVIIYDPIKGKSYAISPPSNIDEIEDYFENMKAAAQ